MSVPRCFGSKDTSSVRIRITCDLPFPGGTNNSTLSVNRIRLTRSLFFTAENASNDTSCAAASRFVVSLLPNRPEADMSSTGGIPEEYARTIYMLLNLLLNAKSAVGERGIQSGEGKRRIDPVGFGDFGTSCVEGFAEGDRFTATECLEAAQVPFTDRAGANDEEFHECDLIKEGCLADPTLFDRIVQSGNSCLALSRWPGVGKGTEL